MRARYFTPPTARPPPLGQRTASHPEITPFRGLHPHKPVQRSTFVVGESALWLRTIVDGRSATGYQSDDQVIRCQRGHSALGGRARHPEEGSQLSHRRNHVPGRRRSSSIASRIAAAMSAYVDAARWQRTSSTGLGTRAKARSARFTTDGPAAVSRSRMMSRERLSAAS